MFTYVIGVAGRHFPFTELSHRQNVDTVNFCVNNVWYWQAEASVWIAGVVELRTRTEYSGLKVRIELLEHDDGSCPAATFLDQLGRQDRQRLDTLFCRMGDHGSITNKEQFKKIEGTDIWEFKRYQVRLFCFFAKGTPARLVIIDGVTKKSDKHKKSDLDRVDVIRKKFNGD